MLLKHGVEDFPECRGLPIFCYGCKATTYSEETIAVSKMRVKEDGGQELVQFLACYSCVLEKTDHAGRC